MKGSFSNMFFGNVNWTKLGKGILGEKLFIKRVTPILKGFQSINHIFLNLMEKLTNLQEIKGVREKRSCNKF